MTGGFKATTSRLAIATIASVLASGAMAADLGGNCCADLEERVAELEATTARKGNRKVKLTVSGQVNEAILFWDDGGESNAYVVSNNFGRTRFRFTGDAKINNDWSAGYLLEIGVRYANSGNRNQNSASGSAVTSSNGNNSFDIRHSAWWLENKHLGRVWVGNTSTATDGITEINLANVITGGNDFSSLHAGFRLRNSDGTLSNTTWGGIRNGGNFNVGEGDRDNTVRYTAPTLHGFTFSTAWGGDDFWDAALRYAGEFNGVRIAAGIGYQQYNTHFAAGGGGCANAGPGNVPSVNESTVDCNEVGLSASVMHVPTGLFVTGSYGILEDKNRKNITATANDEDEAWFVQAGIEKNWFGLGKTTFFGQYGEADTGMAIGGGARNSAAAGGGFAALGAAGFVADSKVREFAIGLNQSIDAAAMDLYITYFNVEADVNVSATGGQAGKTRASVQDFDAVIMGAIIRF